jgi:phage-related protein
MGSFAEFVQYLATPAALGVVSSMVLQLIRRVWPQIDEGWAFLASVVAAVVISAIAMYLVPLLPTMPPEVEKLWPFVVWFFQQVWYWLMRDRAAFYRAGNVPE